MKLITECLNLRRLRSEDLHKLYASPNIRVIKSGRVRWVGRVACMGEMRNAHSILVGIPDGKKTIQKT
jgi:hypothetical protein